MNSILFSPFELGGVGLANRIVVAPMAQYSADVQGRVGKWHLMHLGNLAVSGASLVIMEATAVEPGEGGLRAGAVPLLHSLRQRVVELDGARVGKGIRTTNGDIDVGAGSRVEGGIEYDASTGFSVSFTHHVPRIVIGPGAVIQGPLKFGREVRLYVSDRAQTGPVTGATPISFSGDQPPAGQ